MKNIRFRPFSNGSVIRISSYRTKVPANTSKSSKSNYNYHDAFAPFFYTKNGTSTRSASGQPGAEYWQNRADYVLTANAQNNEIVGTDIIPILIVLMRCHLYG
jgi:hypothetical protein